MEKSINWSDLYGDFEELDVSRLDGIIKQKVYLVLNASEITEALMVGIGILSEGINEFTVNGLAYDFIDYENFTARSTTYFPIPSLDTESFDYEIPVDIEIFDNEIKDTQIQLNIYDVEKAKKRVTKKLHLLYGIQQILIHNRESLDEVIFDLKSRQLQEYYNKLHIIKYSISNEARKAGIDRNMLEYEFEDNQVKLEEYMTKVNGPRVSDQPELKNIVNNYLGELFLERSSILNKGDKILFKNFLDQVGVNLASIDTKENSEEVENSNSLDNYIVTPLVQKKIIDAVLTLESSINRRSGAFGIESRKTSDKITGGFSADQVSETIGVNKNKDITIKKCLEVPVGHETGHMFPGVNEKILDIKGSKYPNYITLEEGKNKFIEFVNGGGVITIEDLDNRIKKPGFGLCFLYIGESGGGKNTVNIMRIFKDLYDNESGKNTNLDIFKNRYLRYKRQFDLLSNKVDTASQFYDKGKVLFAYLAKQSGSLQGIVDLIDLIDEGKKSYDDLLLHREFRKRNGITTPLVRDHFIGRYLVLRLEALHNDLEDIIIEPNSLDEIISQRRDFSPEEVRMLDELVEYIWNNKTEKK